VPDRPSDARGIRPLRVAFFVDSMAASGGTELNAVRVAEALTARGLAAVEVFTLRADGPMRARYEAAGVEVHETPVRSLVSAGAARQVVAVARRLRTGAFDVVHSHDLYTNVLAAPAGRIAGVPAVVASKRWVAWRRSHHLLNCAAYRVAHCVLANSGGVARTLVAADGVPASRVAGRAELRGGRRVRALAGPRGPTPACGARDSGRVPRDWGGRASA
jgi:hypothetical protein